MIDLTQHHLDGVMAIWVLLYRFVFDLSKYSEFPNDGICIDRSASLYREKSRSDENRRWTYMPRISKGKIHFALQNELDE